METISAIDSQPVVVLVDDDSAVLSSLTFALEMEGFSSRAYQNVDDLLAETDPARTGCLVLDYHLPGMNGIDLLRTLRSRGVSAPAIIITTNPSPLVRHRAATEGAAIVEKPLLGNGLIEAIRRSLTVWAR
jgi:FixJ family two-component response regulator